MGASDYVTAVLADTPLAFYELQEAAAGAIDSSGNGLDLLNVTGAPAYQQVGPFGSDYGVRLPPGGSFNTASAISTLTDGFSFECWLKPLSTPATNHSIFAIAKPPGDTCGWNVFVDGNRTFRSWLSLVGFNAESQNVIDSVVGNSLLPSLGVGGSSSAGFDHIVVVRESTIWTYYFNGALDTANAGTLTPITPCVQTQIGDPTANVWDGVFAYLAYYEKALTATDVQDHYDAGLL